MAPCFHFLEKAMATHSSTFAWKIPWMEEPGRLKSMGSLRVGHDGRTSLSLFTSMHWRKKWQPTPVFLPRESQGLGSLVGCRLWGHTESDTTKATQQQQQQIPNKPTIAGELSGSLICFKFTGVIPFLRIYSKERHWTKSHVQNFHRSTGHGESF